MRQPIPIRVARGALVASLIVVAGTTARADDGYTRKSAPAPPGGDSTGFWGGQVASGDTYVGRLVCLRNDQKFAVVGPADACPSGRRVYALQRKDGETTHPLLATDSDMLDRFDELRGKEVRVEGKLYDSTGMILVTALADEEGPGTLPDDERAAQAENPRDR